MTTTLDRKLARRRMARRIDDLLPLELSKETGRLSVSPAPIGKPGGPGLWKVKGMGFPPYFQNVRNALIRNGHSVAEASQITWAAIRRWARKQKTGGERGHVHPEVAAAARAALAGIAKDSARAHAASAARRAEHAYANVVDQLVLREFARTGQVLELADPYHSSLGKFTSAGNQGSAAPKPPTNKGGKTPPTVSPKQKAAYLRQAAADSKQAQALRQEAAKINQQIAALSALVAVEQKYLATAATGNTGAGTGTFTSAGTGTQTATAAAGTKTSAGTGTQTSTAGYNVATTKQMLAQNQAQIKQLTAKRNTLISEANNLDRQAQILTQLANG